jgi:hypothetical protein
VRESNVNALKASLLTYPTLFAFSSPKPDDNGITEQSFFPADRNGFTVARQPMILTWFLFNPPETSGKTNDANDV